MAKKIEKDRTPVTLITTEVLSPYRKGEVFTVEKWIAEQLLDDTRVDADGKTIAVKVEVFNAKREDHVDSLNEQRGKIDEHTPSTKAGKVEVEEDGETGLIDMTRAELNKLAADAGIESPQDLPNKQAVVDAIEASRV